MAVGLSIHTRQQRDLLLLALCAFSTRGWLEAALQGHPTPPSRTGMPDATSAAHEGGATVGSAVVLDVAAPAAAAAKKPKKGFLFRGKK